MLGVVDGCGGRNLNAPEAQLADTWRHEKPMSTEHDEPLTLM
jgi:hypothetical protein